MVWVRLDDSFPDHRKLAELGDYAPVAGWLFICGLAYCNRQLTDGYIPKAHVIRLASFRHLGIETGGVKGLVSVGEDIDGDTLALLLESVGLWEDRDPYWYVHDYPDYQPTKAEVEAEREQKKAAGRAGGIAAATARAQASAQAKSKPVPVPVPDPEPEPEPAAEAAAEEAAAASSDELASRLCRAWETATGTTVSALLADNLLGACEDMPEAWVFDAIAETGLSGARSWKYTAAILDRWKRDGRERADPVAKYTNSAVLRAASAWKEANG